MIERQSTAVLKQLTDGWEIYRSIYRECFNHAEHYYPILTERGFLEGVASILTIGGGEGKLEIRLAKEYGLDLGYVDPSSVYTDIFLASVMEEEIEEQITEIHCDLFESFDTENRYDLIISIHSWYSIGFKRQWIEKALGLLPTGGKCLISITSKQDLFKKELSKYKVNVSERLSDWAISEGFGHDYFTFSVPVPVENIISRGEISRTGKNLIGFINNSSWDELPRKIREKAKETLTRHSRNGGIRMTYGCLVFTK